jgi:hypothetical protein
VVVLAERAGTAVTAPAALHARTSGRGRTRLLFGRTRLDRRTTLAVIVAAAGSALLQGRDLPVPLIPGDAVVRTSPLLPLLVVVPVLQAFTCRLSVLEAAVGGPRLVRARLAWWCAVSVAAAALCAAATWGADPDGAGAGTAVVSTLSFLGLGLLGAGVLGADLAWLAPCVLALCTFFLGKDYDNVVRGWAWLLQPPTGTSPVAVTVLLMTAGCVAYARWDTTGLLRRRALL